MGRRRRRKGRRQEEFNHRWRKKKHSMGMCTPSAQENSEWLLPGFRNELDSFIFLSATPTVSSQTWWWMFDPTVWLSLKGRMNLQNVHFYFFFFPSSHHFTLLRCKWRIPNGSLNAIRHQLVYFTPSWWTGSMHSIWIIVKGRKGTKKVAGQMMKSEAFQQAKSEQRSN